MHVLDFWWLYQYVLDGSRAGFFDDNTLSLIFFSAKASGSQFQVIRPNGARSFNKEAD
jgi:hypothetical protein